MSFSLGINNICRVSNLPFVNKKSRNDSLKSLGSILNYINIMNRTPPPKPIKYQHFFFIPMLCLEEDLINVNLQELFPKAFYK